MTRLAVLGAGGHGRVVADTTELCGWEYIVFSMMYGLVDRKTVLGA